MGVLGLFAVVSLNGLDQSEEEMLSLLPYETDDFEFVYKNVRNSIISRKQHSSRETTGDKSKIFGANKLRLHFPTWPPHGECHGQILLSNNTRQGNPSRGQPVRFRLF